MLLMASSVCGLFKWRQFEPEVILLAVGCYLRFSLSYRDVEELLAERGLLVDHVTVWRWVQSYAPELERCLRQKLRPTNDSWRVDETYIRVKGKWVYLYRAVDSSGATIDLLLSAKRDAAAAERFLAKALGAENHPAPRVINSSNASRTLAIFVPFRPRWPASPRSKPLTFLSVPESEKPLPWSRSCHNCKNLIYTIAGSTTSHPRFADKTIIKTSFAKSVLTSPT